MSRTRGFTGHEVATHVGSRSTTYHDTIAVLTFRPTRHDTVRAATAASLIYVNDAFPERLPDTLAVLQEVQDAYYQDREAEVSKAEFLSALRRASYVSADTL